jgi:hypothetical protein
LQQHFPWMLAPIAASCNSVGRRSVVWVVPRFRRRLYREAQSPLAYRHCTCIEKGQLVRVANNDSVVSIVLLNDALAHTARDR